jgi:hypothetical protein
VHAIHIYRDSDIKFGRKFVDTIKALPNGDMVIDLRKFGETVPESVLDS